MCIFASSPSMRKISSYKRSVLHLLLTGFCLVGLLMMLITIYTQGIDGVTDSLNDALFLSASPTRKLLGKVMEPNRMWGERCSNSDIVVNQGPTAPLPSGIPTYTVEIMNVCATGCDISAIHLSCGWFSSARMINPKVFKRLRFDDCLVNDGRIVVNGGTLSFQYANTYKYPLSVSSVRC